MVMAMGSWVWGDKKGGERREREGGERRMINELGRLSFVVIGMKDWVWGERGRKGRDDDDDDDEKRGEGVGFGAGILGISKKIRELMS